MVHQTSLGEVGTGDTRMAVEASVINPGAFWSKDTVRMLPRPRERSRAYGSTQKRCLGCNHWLKSHLNHGACTNAHCHTCLLFVDPEPGRPDTIFIREQVDRMKIARYRVYK